jgi:hypothetical protein
LRASRQRDERARVQSTVGVYRLEAEHLQAINTIIQGDLDEMRAFEMEYALAVKKTYCGLPPA